MQCNVPTMRRLRLRIAPADGCAIVRADTVNFATEGCTLYQLEPAVVEADSRITVGLPSTHTIKMHLVTVLPRLGRPGGECVRRSFGTFNRLINGSNDSKQDNEACQTSKKDIRSTAGRGVVAVAQHHPARRSQEACFSFRSIQMRKKVCVVNC